MSSSDSQYQDKRPGRRNKPRPDGRAAPAVVAASDSAAGSGTAAGSGSQQPVERVELGLAERLAFLERHVQQQDREIYAQSEQIRRLQMLVQQLRGQMDAAKAQGSEGGGAADFPLDERPPHY